jgi:hypothetical protein
MVQFNEFYGLFGPLNAVIEKVREAAGNVINSMVGADDFLIEHWTCMLPLSC